MQYSNKTKAVRKVPVIKGTEGKLLAYLAEELYNKHTLYPAGAVEFPFFCRNSQMLSARYAATLKSGAVQQAGNRGNAVLCRLCLAKKVY